MKTVSSPGMDTSETVNLAGKGVAALHGIGLWQFRRIRVSGSGSMFINVSAQMGRRGGRMPYPVGRSAVMSASSGLLNGDSG
ncbi:MAG TPA: hypothetical protein VFF64_23660 [Candidatus Eremiobacteraceae bacterium]|nr:hypothetical protein [Candidatus Eremiobacteraceae bacterium]